GRQGITSVLLEGGGELNASAIAAGIVDKVMVFIAPKIAGGSMAPTYVEGPGVELIKDAIALTSPKIRRFGEDIMLEAYFKKPSDVNVMKA
ncbi:MAG: dihydrofolate reductase family protein, partial [Actinomycetota bacterium]|nr:dihydrofolate reductase family protein [Actinomycetota bacterium]